MDRSRFIIRPNHYERQEPSKDSRKVYIYCEGSDREYKYFLFFSGLSTNINIIPIPSKEGKTDPEKLMQAAIVDFEGTEDNSPIYELDLKQNDEVWFVIDTDEWGPKISVLRNYCKSKQSWYVAQSNPCFEIWLYYHFFTEAPIDSEVRSYDSTKQYVDMKIPGGFDSRKMPVRIGDAITNSENVFSETNGEPDMYMTEVFKLGKVIFPFVADILKV
jgi:hypothetical protein